MPKLTLSVDGKVVAKAKELRRHCGISTSQMVETYLSAVAGNQPAQPTQPPILKALRGALRGADPEAARTHRDAKY